MFVIREVLHCKPGQVRPLLEKFKVLSAALQEMGQKRLRLLTDVGGEAFWTLVAEVQVERLEGFFEVEEQLFANASVREAMADYHDFVREGRREIYRIEA